MQRTQRRVSLVLAAAAGLLAACDSPAVPPPFTPPQPPIYITGVDSLVPGASATLRGTNMKQLRQLIVDGHAATFRVISDEMATFDVPVMRACDVDGRRVEINVNSPFGTVGVVRPRDVIRLDVGESVSLPAGAVSCVQLPEAAQDFVFAVASWSTDRTVDVVFELQALTAQPSALMAGATARPRTHAAEPFGHAHELRLLPQPPAHAVTGQAGFSFDSYQAASAGDVLHFVDWANPAAATATTLDELPRYTATVVAVTATQLIVVDDRAPDAALFSTPAVRQRFAAAADIADRVMLDALRAVVRPDIALPAGAGGRMVSTLMPMNASAGSIRLEELQPRLGASGFYHTLLNTYLINFSPETIARIMIHEAAHLADFEPVVRRSAGAVASVGWYSEALAVAAEDAAARLALGAPAKARASEARWPDGVPRSSIAHSASPSAPTAPPFGTPGAAAGAAGAGAYDRGARIVRYAQEQLGAGGPTLHQLLAARTAAGSGDFHQRLEAWSAGAIAEVIGMSTTELLRNSMLADLTNDLVPADAVARWALPQVMTWDHSPAVDRDYGNAAGGRIISRGSPFSATVAVPSGGYAYWYIPAGSHAAGLSLHATGIQLAGHHEVIITRLR
jgi:hypothetical protein